MPSLSNFEKELLNPNQQEQILNNKKYRAESDKKKDKLMGQSDHWRAEEIRKQQGFSGGTDGSGYIPVDNFKPLDVPTIGDYDSPYEADLMEYLDKFKNQWDYVPPYQKDIDNLIDKLDNQREYTPKYQPYIDKALNKVLSRNPFDYDPSKDEAWNNFLERVQGASEESYNLNMEGFKSMSGGNLPDWVDNVAREAQSAMNLQAQEYVEQFEDLSYKKYSFESQDNINQVNQGVALENQSIQQFVANNQNKFELLNILQSQDAIAYNRFRDRVSDDKEYAKLLLDLDQREFEKFKFVSDQAYTKFSEEASLYSLELEWKQNEWRKAMERTELTGYVNNQDSILLQVKTGTPSKTARERVEKMEDWKKEQDLNIEFEMKRQEYNHDFNVQIVNLQEGLNFERFKNNLSYQDSIQDAKKTMEDELRANQAYAMQNYLDSDKDAMIKLSETDWNKAYKLYDDFESQINSTDFLKKSRADQMAFVTDYVNRVYNMAGNNSLGKNSAYIASFLEDKIMSSETVKDFYFWEAKQEAIDNAIIDDLESKTSSKGVPFLPERSKYNIMNMGNMVVGGSDGKIHQIGFDKYMNTIEQQFKDAKKIEDSNKQFYTDFSKRATKEKKESMLGGKSKNEVGKFTPKIDVGNINFSKVKKSKK